MVGPFIADGKSNDVSIEKNLLYQNRQGILERLHDDDVILIDRGLRDAAKAIKMLGFHPPISRFVNGQKQLPAADTNYTRCVTKAP